MEISNRNFAVPIAVDSPLGNQVVDLREASCCTEIFYQIYNFISYCISSVIAFITCDSALSEAPVLDLEEGEDLSSYSAQRWYRPLIEEHYVTKHGPFVFDRGLHGGNVEPGFISSLLNAVTFASKNPLTIESYKKINELACSHFSQLPSSVIACTPDKIGKFRAGNEVYCPTYRDKPIDYPTRVEVIRAQVHKIMIKYGLEKDICTFEKQTETSHNIKIKVEYIITDNAKLEELVEKFFQDFREIIENLPLPRERNESEREIALRAIAELHQNLEWLHPFHDGQSRTTLIVLRKLLIEQGFTPGLFKNPFFAAFATLDEWVEYLKEAMEKWKIEERNFSS